MNRSIWITWENQRRNRELSHEFQFKLYELSEIDSIKNHLLKYFCGIFKTFLILLKERPSLICCQNPSIVLSFFLILIKPIFKFSVCVDSHYAGLFPLDGQNKILNIFSKAIQKNGDLTIVTNSKHKASVERNGGRAVVLPDKIPSIPILSPVDLKGHFKFLFVCTFADDEPFDIVFDAAHEIDTSIVIYVTGDFNKKQISLKKLPNNIVLLGFISNFKYEQMLNSVDAIIDLTTREDCLVCGAYESVAIGKPMILSNTDALKNYFTMGAIFTDNDTKSIVNSIKQIVNNRERLTSDCIKFKNKCNIEWEAKALKLSYILRTLPCYRNVS